MPASKRAQFSACTALIVVALCSTWASPAGASRFGNTLTQAGPEQTVFNWSRDQCEPDGIPDAATRAFRDASNNVHLLLQHWVTHQLVGPSLNSVVLSCAVTMGSTHNADPAAYADNEWVTSPYTLDGTNFYALMHMEYLGRQHPGQCTAPATQYNVCRFMAITFGTSTNAGASWTHVAPPGHLVAALPYKYVPNLPTYGYSNPSNIVKRPDGFYYSLVHATAYQQQQSGSCLIRTNKLADPTSWRAWDGTGFNIQFIDPYTSSAAPAQHVCTPVDWNIGGMSDSLTFNTWLGQYLLVGPSTKFDPDLNRDVAGFYYSTSTDLIHWSSRMLLMEAVLPWTYNGCGDDEPVQYPSLIDPNSPSRNFETSGRTMNLYFVRDHYNQYCNQTLNRDLIRIPVAFPDEAPPGPGYPRPRGATPIRLPLVPAYNQCSAPDSTHGPPLAYRSCRRPVLRSSYLTLGTPDANGKSANGIGSVQLRAIAGNASTPANEADVGLTTSMTDVRRKGDLSDYTGQLQASLTLRLTDHSNADAPSRNAATVSKATFAFTVPCTVTAATDRGATCAATTTANSVLPGSVVEGKRAIWELSRLVVLDGGPDGLAGTASGNTTFAVPGLFVP